MGKFREYEAVVLDRDIPDGGPLKGTFGIVLELLDGDGLAVEFFDDGGATIEVLLISDSQVRPATSKEKRIAFAAQESLPISVDNV
jgi:hypothetical protein